eukprot:8989988-Alexandrium_andersonii.AAC.1
MLLVHIGNGEVHELREASNNIGLSTFVEIFCSTTRATGCDVAPNLDPRGCDSYSRLTSRHLSKCERT